MASRPKRLTVHNDCLTFGQYKSLTVLEVYQGSPSVDRKLLCGFLNECLLDASVPRPHAFEFCLVRITEEEIFTVPDIHNEELPITPKNVVSLGDLSGALEAYFNTFFYENWYGIIKTTIKKFNSTYGPKVIGGDPEYITWCVQEKIIELDDKLRTALERFPVYRLLGISVDQISENIYSHYPRIKEEQYKFPLLAKYKPETYVEPRPLDAKESDALYERDTYDKYEGSYAQDVEGLSDDFIDDALDGQPDAYWNID